MFYATFALGAMLTTMQWLTYWVVYAFLTVFESAVSAVYWFRKCRYTNRTGYFANCLAFYYTFKFVLILWMSLPQTAYVATPSRTLIQAYTP
jgi:receptor expression-enhancing protein 5/6